MQQSRQANYASTEEETFSTEEGVSEEEDYQSSFPSSEGGSFYLHHLEARNAPLSPSAKHSAHQIHRSPSKGGRHERRISIGVSLSHCICI